MLARELLPLARFFDRSEVSLRRLGRWAKSSWLGLSAAAKVLLVLTGVATLGYAAYHLFLS